MNVIECKEVDRIEDGDELEVDYKKGVIFNKKKDEKYTFRPLPDFLRMIVEKGGLINFAREIYERSRFE